MTTLNQARAAVYKRFLDEWADGDEPLTSFCFDNEVLDGENLTWARCSVRSMQNTQETLGAPGNRKFKRRALARVEVYTEPGSGLRAADELIQVAVAMFEGRSLLGTAVKLYEVSSAEVGLVDDGRWFLSTAQAYFDYEQIK
jgi:hypothetical protein